MHRVVVGRTRVRGFSVSKTSVMSRGADTALRCSWWHTEPYYCPTNMLWTARATTTASKRRNDAGALEQGRRRRCGARRGVSASDAGAERHSVTQLILARVSVENRSDRCENAHTRGREPGSGALHEGHSRTQPAGAARACSSSGSLATESAHSEKASGFAASGITP